MFAKKTNSKPDYDNITNFPGTSIEKKGPVDMVKDMWGHSPITTALLLTFAGLGAVQVALFLRDLKDGFQISDLGQFSN